MGVDHYENFPVASVLCPPRLRPAVKAIYWFARTADDLADEGDADAAHRLFDLGRYRRDLMSTVAGATTSARWKGVFGPLREAMVEHALPPHPLADLLSAFEQDVVLHDYADREQLLAYCRLSANPVGRLLLHLYGVGDSQSLAQSDAICTGLQLANFWQDLGEDAARGRLYAPRTDRVRHGVRPERMLARSDSAEVHAMLAELVAWARALLLQGAPLAHKLPGRAGWELRLVVQGGLLILDKIERNGHDTLLRRPALARRDLPLLLWRALAMRAPRKRSMQAAA